MSKIEPVKVEVKPLPELKTDVHVPDGHIYIVPKNEDGSEGVGFFQTKRMERYYSDTTKYIIKKKGNQ